MDSLSIVADEVALEGLDGITIPSLWVRLEHREPKFPLKLDGCTKEYIWKSLVFNAEFKFYVLPQERGDVVLFDRYKDIDPDTGIETTESFFDVKTEIYPIHIILENKDGIQGSCALFKERKDVTKHVRSPSFTPLVNLEEALNRYGRKLVVVASQTQRFRALIGSESDPDLKLSDDSFCLLERVGRARWQGELQSDLHGNSFKTDARKLHYIRKSLIKYGLIGMQSHVTRLKTKQQQQHSILLHLKRFHILRRSKYDILMESMSNLVQQFPDQFATLPTLKEQLNVDGRTFKSVISQMRDAKLIELSRIPLEDIDPSAGPCNNKNGTKVLVRCLRLLKPYTSKGVTEDDEDDEEEGDTSTAGKRTVPSEGRIMEKDVLSQAYQIVLSSGTKGIPKSDIGFRMNIGKLESRMIVRILEREGLIKGFMVDEGRQRTTKYISNKFVSVSDQLQLFAEERKKLLHSSASQTIESSPATPATPSTSKLSAAKKKPSIGGDKDAEEDQQTCDDRQVDKREEGFGEEKDKRTGKTKAGRKTSSKRRSVTAKNAKADILETQQTAAKSCGESASRVTDEPASVPSTEQAPISDEEMAQEQVTLVPANPLPHTEDGPGNKEDNNLAVVKDVDQLQVCSRQNPRKSLEKSQETYRLLRRKNLIVENLQNMKIVEGLFPLQKIINDHEKQEGVSSKCCRKTVSRLVNTLRREGLLKIYTTTVIQDGITKKVDMVAHPSIQPNDDIVNRVIEQVRFKISSSYSAVRLHQDKSRGPNNESEETAASLKAQKSKSDKRRASQKEKEFKPQTVKGLGKTFGFQPKMHRLRVVHNFLWYLIHDHPLRDSATPDSNNEILANIYSADPDVKHTDSHEKKDPKDAPSTKNEASAHVTPQTTKSTAYNLDAASGDEEEEQKDKLQAGHSLSNMRVYVDEDSWKKFIPPVRVHKEYSSGWAMVGDLLLCIPLSVFTQVIQINYMVEGLEEYLNDPVKQHYLVRALPARMRRQLLFKRKYLFSFHENLQKLIYMGLLQFAPVEKFKEKDQFFLYLKRKATIVDTTVADPHYWLVTESQEKPFDRRQYTFNTCEDVENYWFDLMCVCLNTPLGVIRGRRSETVEESAPSFVQERNVFVGLAYLLKGSFEVCDDGSIPGDGKGAGGLHSEFFAHLKRNWLWTNHLLAVKKNPAGSEEPSKKIRLKSLLTKTALSIALKAGGATAPRYMTTKRPMMAHTVEVVVEPASRNQQVVGGKKQKRKRIKKEVVKVPRKKKKEPKKRSPAHDEADHQALKMMTRQRVYWSVQEDSLMMLCCVASQLLNSKLTKPFVAHCVVRDLLHAEFEISADKTSVAVGRRSRYILKNPQTFLNYRICLAEVYQDKTLSALLEEKKPVNPNKPEDCAAAFSEYVRLLRQKFSSVVSAQEVTIPDSKQELFSRFKVSTLNCGGHLSYKDTLNCTDDIHAIVLQNLIQSTLAMTNTQMKSLRSFQTFHMYSKYNQEVLCQVFLNCKKRGLVNRRRVNPLFGPKKNRSLPILPMSFQLSQTYYRCFSSRFPHSLCTDSFYFLKSLLRSGARDDRPVTAFYHETENRAENMEEVLERKRRANKSKEKENVDGRQVNEKDKTDPESANFDEQIKAEDCQTAVTCDERADDHQNDKVDGPAAPCDGSAAPCDGSAAPGDVSAAPCDGPAAPCDVSAAPCDGSAAPGDGSAAPGDGSAALGDGSAAPCDGSAAPCDGPAEPGAAPEAAGAGPDLSDMLQFSLDSPGGACALSLSLMSLGLLSVHLSIPKQIVVVDSSLVDNTVMKSIAALEEEDDDDYDGEECDRVKKVEVKAQQASHTNYLVMRGYCSPGIVKLRNLNTNDNIVVRSCIMKLQLRNTPAHHIFNTENLPDLHKWGPSLLPSILTHSTSSFFSPPTVEECDRRLIEQRGYTPQDIEACAQLRRRLDAAGENGVDIYDLSEAHTQPEGPQSGCSRSLQQFLKDLQEEGLVLRVGGLGERWVLIQHAEAWMLTLNSKQRPQSHVTSGRLPFFKSQHSIPFMRKRCRQEVQEAAEEPQAKKLHVDQQESEDAQVLETSSPQLPDSDNQQKERDDERSGDELNSEVERDTLKQSQGEVEEEVEQHQEETEKRRTGRRQWSERIDTTGSADLEDEENVSFISRPWRVVDGKLNRQVCKGMLEAVLYHIMSRPGLTQQTLVEHYKDVLQPMAVLDLIQALLEIGCVTKKRLVKSAKPSLFSRSVSRTTSDTDVKMDKPDEVYYEPTISCCLLLGRVLPTERHWNSCLP